MLWNFMSWPRCQHGSIPPVCARSSASASVGVGARVRGFYTCRPVIIRTSALTAIGILERGGCTASPSTEASYTRSAVGGGVHDILHLWVLQLGCWRGTLVNTTTSVNHCTSLLRRVARSTGDVPSVALVPW
ncbi:hypothetical protein B296_00015336 [Ensete ventricosum]|uniref:Uncharacterized protein n=1 Tax=Ensete ventricosum TaxID=4639 RepID=A0A426YYV0_ENSVE|nr:hypothetical protein B296_00015336 [Ensete ventricosum]